MRLLEHHSTLVSFWCYIPMCFIVNRVVLALRLEDSGIHGTIEATRSLVEGVNQNFDKGVKTSKQMAASSALLVSMIPLSKHHSIESTS